MIPMRAQAVGRHAVRRCRQAGVTLVELVVFIVVASILAVGLTAAFLPATRGTPVPGQANIAMHLAQERMELILAQKRINGFATFVDPCTLVSPPIQCTVFPTGYNVTATIVTGWDDGAGVNNNYRVITVNVTGTQSTSYMALVANY